MSSSRAQGLRSVLLATLALCACSKKTAPTEPPIGQRTATTVEPSPSVVSPPVREAGGEAAPQRGVVHVEGPALLRMVRANGGHGTLINAWASWCGPCRRELPMFRSLADNLRARGVSILLVSVDEPEAEPELVRMLTAEGFEEPFYVAARPLGEFKKALHPTWPGVIPATFLFDATARRRYFWAGPVYENELLPVAEGLIAGKDIDGEARFDLAPGQNVSR